MIQTAYTLVGSVIALIAMTSMISVLTYYNLSPTIVEIPYAASAAAPYVYQSNFTARKLGVLNTPYWVVDPQLISGTCYIEDGMLKIESNNRYQVGSE